MLRKITKNGSLTKRQATAVENRVKRGAQWLDQNRPSWYHTVSLKKLDLSDQFSCVLGQIGKAITPPTTSGLPYRYVDFIIFDDGCRLPGNFNHLGLTVSQAISRGFIVADGFWAQDKEAAYYGALNEAWKQQIRDRRKGLSR